MVDVAKTTLVSVLAKMLGPPPRCGSMSKGHLTPRSGYGRPGVASMWSVRVDTYLVQGSFSMCVSDFDLLPDLGVVYMPHMTLHAQLVYDDYSEASNVLRRTATLPHMDSM